MTNKPLGLILLIIAVYAQTISPQQMDSASYLPSVLPCIAYRSGNCISCPYDYHISHNQCYLNITGCLTYNIN